MSSFTRYFVVLLLIFGYGCNTLHRPQMDIQLIAKLPTLDSGYAIGVAGAFAGMSHHRLIVAGGANFPDKKPWEGGVKMWYNHLYVFDMLQKKWIDSIYRLPQKMAYGYSFSLSDRVIFTGGDNEQLVLSSVYSIKYDTIQQSIQIDTLPSLPLPLSNMAGVAVGQQLYIAGGTTTGGMFTKTFLTLDLQQHDKGWTRLSEWNGQPLGVAMLVKQGDYLLLFSGRGMENGKLTPYKSVYRYSLVNHTWETLTVHNPQALMAGAAITPTDSTVLFLSGDTGETFQKIIDLQSRGLKDSVAMLQKQHTGFGNTVYCFHTNTATFEKYTDLPFTGRVTAPVVHYKEGYIVVSGEIRPGIRTPEIVMYANQ